VCRSPSISIFVLSHFALFALPPLQFRSKPRVGTVSRCIAARRPIPVRSLPPFSRVFTTSPLPCVLPTRFYGQFRLQFRFFLPPILTPSNCSARKASQLVLVGTPPHSWSPFPFVFLSSTSLGFQPRCKRPCFPTTGNFLFFPTVISPLR